LTLAATALGSALAFLDATVVIVALPRMEDDLGLGLAGQQWVVLGYALALAALYLVSGAIGDRLGLRRTFVAGTVLFAVASLLCAAAWSEPSLVAGRVLQGVGGAALTTSSLALLRVVWAGEAGRAIGLWTSLTGIATIAGPPLGGLIVETASWRWIFLLNLPLALVVVALALAARAPTESTRGRATLDVVGAGLTAAGLGGLTYGIVEWQARGPVAVAPFLVGGAVALAALAVWTLRAPDTLVPVELLRRPGFVPANLVTLLVYAALGAHILFLPLYLQLLGLSPTVAGLSFTPPSIALVLLAPSFGRLADRHGPRWPVAGGSLAIAAGAVLLLPVTSTDAAWSWGVASVLVFAVGLAALVAPITAAALAPAPERLAGIAAGVNQTVARVGGVVSVAAVGALATWLYARAGGVGEAPFDPALGSNNRSATVEAFRGVVVAVAALALAGAALAATLLESTGRPSDAAAVG
jgi:EmrB/QacA subfamily drug resistance transporter